MNDQCLIIMADFRDRFLKDIKLNIIDLGSQVINHPDQVKVGSFKKIFNRPKWKYTGADTAEGINVDIILQSQYKWQFADGQFDVVISGNTIEHVERPWEWFIEAARILKPGGMMCVIAPSMWRWHRYPLDCYRFYPDGMKALAEYSGLEFIESKLTDRIEHYQLCHMIARKP